MVTSVDIMKEVSRVLYYPRIQQRFKPREETIRRFFRLVFRKAIVTENLYKTDRIIEDPTDNMLLACAMEGRADFIVSRDPHLRNLNRFQGIEIVDVRSFVDRVKRGE